MKAFVVSLAIVLAIVGDVSAQQTRSEILTGYRFRIMEQCTKFLFQSKNVTDCMDLVTLNSLKCHGDVIGAYLYGFSIIFAMDDAFSNHDDRAVLAAGMKEEVEYLVELTDRWIEILDGEKEFLTRSDSRATCDKLRGELVKLKHQVKSWR